jgi:hypothetical protein
MHIPPAVVSRYQIPTCAVSANAMSTDLDATYLNLCNNSIDFKTEFWLIRSAT